MNDNLNLFDVLTVLANKNRINILKTCQKNQTLSAIARRIEHTVPATQVHVQKLLKVGLLEKITDRSYSTTPFGQAMLLCISSTFFLEENRQFLNEHSFNDLPPRFVSSFGCLYGSKHTTQITDVFPIWQKIVDSSKRYLNCIFSEAPILLEDEIKIRMENGVKVRFLFGRNSRIYDSSEFVEKLELKKLKHHESLEKRIAENVGVNIMISDRWACIMFPNLDDVIDMHHIFYSKDLAFRQWCLDFFNYKWDSSEPIARLTHFNV